MAAEFPAPGQVFNYRYLWKWQSVKGETEGRKTRPCCVTVVVSNVKGQQVLFIAPITSKHPENERAALEVPETEARRARLDTDIPLWVILDELNADILEASYTLEDRTPRGIFSPAFTDQIVRGVQTVRRTGRMRFSNRSD